MTSKKRESSKDATIESLDQIRSILNGKQEKETAHRFERVEERLSRDVQKLRVEFDKRVAAIGAEYEAEVESLRAEIAESHKGSDTAGKAQGQKLIELGRTLDGRIAKQAERSTGATKQLGEKFLAQQTALREDLEVRCEELEAGLEEVRTTMVDKEELSGFFAEIALKLVNRKQIRLNQ